MAFKFEFFTKDILFKNHTIRTYSIGEGESNVFSFPAFPHSGLMYMWFLNHYKLDKVRFITFDLPGWIGYSDNVFRDEDFAMETLVAIAKQVVKAYELNKFAVVGYSFGGPLALMLNKELPEQITKLALVSTIINGNLSKREPVIMLSRLAAKLNRRNLGLGKVIEKYIQTRFNYYKKELLRLGSPQNDIEMYQGMLQQISGHTLIDGIASLFARDWTPYLQDIVDKPVMVINSRQEGRMFRRQARELRKILLGEKSLFFPGSHEDFVLKPNNEVVREVVRFLQN